MEESLTTDTLTETICRGKKGKFLPGCNDPYELSRSKIELFHKCQRCFWLELNGYRLLFHKRSIDTSGKCNAFFTGNPSDEVLGVVFEIIPAEKQFLDRAEGLGKGYEEKIVSIETNFSNYKCYTYVAATAHIDDRLAPYTWYRDIVAAGAKEHNLPRAYIQVNILSVEALNDADVDRDARERKFLELKT